MGVMGRNGRNGARENEHSTGSEAQTKERLHEDFDGHKQVLVANRIGSARYVPEGGD